MLGLVLWRDADGATAVIWCEDQQELAHWSGRENLVDPNTLPKVGDLVHFRISEDAGIRRAVDLHILAETTVPDLAEKLQTTAAQLAAAPRLARVG
ncbi:hypothetical protein [Phaeovulum sp.]|uniref:hypothetical protein n=1 Tax=Phaeovulum sp. TaxID=2934796 RepID=UPI003563CA5F